MKGRGKSFGRDEEGRRLRALNEPRPVRVRTDAHDTPVAVARRRGFRLVEAVRETWRIDDEWWRAPVSRRYYTVVLEGGRLLTLYRDLEEGGWFVQG